MIHASPARVFASLTDPALFPTWGPERVEGSLVAGERPVLDFGPHGGGKACIYVVAVDPPRRFAFRWMQGETNPVKLLGDPLKTHNTLVEFLLEEVPEGTRVRVVESGLAALPGHAGLDPHVAREHMGKGWELMLGALGRHFAGAPMLQDRIENEREFHVPPQRLYQALVHLESWWAQRVDGAFAVGETPLLDFGPFGKFRVHVVATQASKYVAYRRVQGVDDPAVGLEDPRQHPNTLIEWHLEAVSGGTLLKQSESGFESLSGENVLAHFRRAHQGWTIILGILEMHLNPK